MKINKRIDGIVIVLFSLFYAFLALNLEEGLNSNHIISSSTFPLFISSLLFFLGMVIIFQNSGSDHKKIWPTNKQVWYKIFIFIIILFLYTGVFDYLGFFLSTVIIVIYISIILGGKFWQSFLFSIIMCLMVQILFVNILEINLPLGNWFDSILEKLFSLE